MLKRMLPQSQKCYRKPKSEIFEMLPCYRNVTALGNTRNPLPDYVIVYMLPCYRKYSINFRKRRLAYIC